jgi:hypothetical protein
MSQTENGRRGRLDADTASKINASQDLTRLPAILRQALEMPFEPVDVRDYGTTDDGKRQLTSIDPNAVIHRLTDCFGGAWSFEIKEYKVYFEAAQVIATVRLSYTCMENSPDGKGYHFMPVVKDAIGNATIKFSRPDSNGQPPATPYYNLGWDIKSAVTDGLKKAASLFGIGLYMWERDGSKESPVQQPQDRFPNAGQWPAGQAFPNAQVQQPNPAQPFQIDKICKFFAGLNYPLEQWAPWFGFNNLNEVTVDLANSILSGQHPIMVDFQQKTGHFINPGLKATMVQ